MSVRVWRICVAGCLVFLSMFWGEDAASAVWYVDAGAPGPQDGTTWTQAFHSLQAGVNAASAAGGGDVWVAEGTYRSTANTVLTMAPGVRLYGGFAGGETAL